MQAATACPPILTISTSPFSCVLVSTLADDTNTPVFYTLSQFTLDGIPKACQACGDMATSVSNKKSFPAVSSVSNKSSPPIWTIFNGELQSARSAWASSCDAERSASRSWEFIWWWLLPEGPMLSNPRSSPGGPSNGD